MVLSQDDTVRWIFASGRHQQRVFFRASDKYLANVTLYYARLVPWITWERECPLKVLLFLRISPSSFISCRYFPSILLFLDVSPFSYLIDSSWIGFFPLFFVFHHYLFFFISFSSFFLFPLFPLSIFYRSIHCFHQFILDWIAYFLSFAPFLKNYFFYHFSHLFLVFLKSSLFGP